jgi:hypothetical protein
MRDRKELSHPPSDPHPVLARPTPGPFATEERPLRVQLTAALLLGLVLVASGLYLWRRPQSPKDSQVVDDPSASAAALSAEPPPAPAAVDAGQSPVALSDPRVLGCHDRGPKVTPAGECDHLVSIEKALSTAVEQSAACVLSSAPGASIEYVADVSFARRRVSVSLPRAGRSVQDRKVLRACASAVRGALQSLALDGIDHQHARYRISVTATYRGSSATTGAGGAYPARQGREARDRNGAGGANGANGANGGGG